MIKFDLDGVLVDLIFIAEDIMLQHGIKRIPTKTFQFNTEPEISDDMLWGFFYRAYDLWDVTPIYPGVTEIFSTLFSLTGEPVQVITARPRDSAVSTHEIVHKLANGIPYTIALTDSGDDKYLYLSPNDILIEDRRKTVLHLADIGIRSIVIDKDYNKIENESQIPEIITRVSSVHEIIPMLPNLL